MKSQSDIDALVKKYGGTSVAAPPSPPMSLSGGPDIDALVRKYGGTTEAAAPTPPSPSAPIPPEMPEAQVPFSQFGSPKWYAGLATNLPGSLWDFVSSIPEAIGGAAKATVGAAQMASPAFQRMGGEAVPDYRDAIRKLPQGMKDKLVERYGGWDRVYNTAYTDPVGFLADLSTVLAPVEAGARISGNVARVAGAAGTGARLVEAGNVLGETSRALDPFHVIAKTGGAIIDATNPGVAKVMGLGVGRKGEEMQIAINKTSPQFRRALRGEVSESKLMEQVRTAVDELKDDRAAQYQKTLLQIPMSQPVPVSNITSDLIQDVQNSRISIVPPTLGQPPTLDFAGSSIGKSGQPLVEQAFRDYADTMSRRDISVAGMDALKRRLDDLLFTSEGSSKATTPSGRIVMRLRDNIHNAIASGVPEYAQLTKDYHTATDFIRRFEKEFSVRPGDNPGTAFRKMQNILNQNSDYRKLLIDALDSKAGTALKDQFAGYALHHWIPQGLMRSGAAMDLLFSLSRGHVPFELLLTSPRLMGSFAMRYGQASRLGGRMLYQMTSPRLRTGQILGRGAPPPEEEPIIPDAPAPFPEVSQFQ